MLKGKRGIIFGALNSESIAWKVAERAVEEGAQIVLTNTAVSLRLGEIKTLAEKCNAPIIAADATNIEEIEALVDKTLDYFGGKIDFVLHSIGMSPNVRKNIEYQDLNYAFLDKTLDISALSFHKVMQVLYKKQALAEWGSIVALSYIAAQRTFVGYNDMADAKALLESIARSFGAVFGRDFKVRVNTVSQSPTATTAGKGIKGMEGMLEFANALSPLGNADADNCADYCITLFAEPLPRRRFLYNGTIRRGIQSLYCRQREVRLVAHHLAANK